MSRAPENARSGHVFLAGFMGSGKSTVGPVLAQLLGLPYFDLDSEIERAAGMKIREIFEKENEAGFRSREASMLEKVCAKPRSVVSLGGGALLSEKNRALLTQSGRTVYLRATIDTLTDRLSPSVAQRPMLAHGGSLSERIQELLTLRSPLYGQCDLTVDTDGKTPQEIAQDIVRLLK